MSNKTMDVFLLNTPQAGIKRSDLVRNLAAAFKKDFSAIEKMLDQPRTLLKKDIEKSLAEKYKVIIETAGGQCELVDHGDELLTTDDLQASPPSLQTSDAGHPASLCPKCATAMQPGRATCPKCFSSHKKFTAKNKITAGLLAFFIGGFGVHRFYLGQWWGIFYLIFWFTLIPSLVSIIEAIVFWSTPDHRWQKKHGQVGPLGGGMIAALVASFFVMIMLAGILAAIAVPAYQDYTIRAKIQGGAPLVKQTRAEITQFIKRTGFVPNQNLDAGLPEHIGNESVSSIKIREGGRMEVHFNLPTLNNAGRTIIWAPKKDGEEVSWSCTGGTLADKYRMKECRGGSRRELQRKNSTKTEVQLTQQLFSEGQRSSIKVPSNWKEDSNLSEEDSIGASSLFEASYAIVIEESKQDFSENFTLTEYTQLIISLMKENIDKAQTPGRLRRLKINGLPAEQLVITGKIDNVSIGYVLTTIESESGFHQVVSWTLLSQLKKKHPLLRSIGRSFMIHPGTLDPSEVAK